MKIAHSVKYGIKPEYASISGIKGIGHIRANLLKEALEESGKMVDDRILLALGLFSIGPQALGMNKRELVDYFLNQGSL